MMIMLSGVPATGSAQEREFYLEKLTTDAKLLLAHGHTPVISLQTAARLASNCVGEAQTENAAVASLALASRCDAVLIIQDSHEINMEKEIIERKDCPVFRNIEEILTIS